MRCRRLRKRKPNRGDFRAERIFGQRTKIHLEGYKMERTGDEQAHTMDYWLIEDELEIHLILNKWKTTKKKLTERRVIPFFIHLYARLWHTRWDNFFAIFLLLFINHLYMFFFQHFIRFLMLWFINVEQLAIKMFVTNKIWKQLRNRYFLKAAF